MPRAERAEALEVAHHLRAWRHARGLTLPQLAELIGMSHQNLGRIERGLVPLSEEHVPKLARALDVQPSDLFKEPGTSESVEPMIRIVGRVGADVEGRVIYSDGHEGWDMAPVPPGALLDQVVALEVIGHSMRGYADDGSLIYFETQRSPPTPDMIGYPVVVETTAGLVLLKRLLKGSRSGVFDLESINGPTLSDQKLRWAADITAIIPPKQARKVIKRGEPA